MKQIYLIDMIRSKQKEKSYSIVRRERRKIKNKKSRPHSLFMKNLLKSVEKNGGKDTKPPAQMKKERKINPKKKRKKRKMTIVKKNNLN